MKLPKILVSFVVNNMLCFLCKKCGIAKILSFRRLMTRDVRCCHWDKKYLSVLWNTLNTCSSTKMQHFCKSFLMLFCCIAISQSKKANKVSIYVKLSCFDNIGLEAKKVCTIWSSTRSLVQSFLILWFVSRTIKKIKILQMMLKYLIRQYI